jgi:amino acid transporter
MQINIESIELLLLIAAVVAMIVRRLHIPYSTGLVLAGIALTFLPYAPNLELTKDLIFKAFLPPLVFDAALYIMFLREGWVVGNAGLLGAWMIILLACAITFFTGLSMSSITTNIRIGSGGAFSIISQSLGLEVGGSIGVPLFFSQALAVAMYVFGFREGWQWIFPEHPAILVDLGTFVVILLIASISTSFAFKIQYVIMAILAASLVSVIGALFKTPITGEIAWFGAYPGSPENNFSGTSFWVVFAVFFPAVTGIMAGANMSGELTNPKRSIPLGTMSAIILTTLIYLGLALVASPEELVNNYTVMIDKALWKPIVLAGLLGATFFSALSSLVGAPRILQALGEHKILLRNSFFAKLSKRGEPLNAMAVTAVIVLLSLLMRNLNAIAPLITMFFLIAYAMINVVVLIEQNLGLLSFRPTLRVPMLVPLLGAAGCFFVMFLINATVSLMSISIIVAFYIVLLNRHLEAPFGDVRSGLFAAVAEWATKKVTKLRYDNERAWQPNILVPIESPKEVRSAYRLLYSLSYPKGSLKILGLSTGGELALLSKRLPDIVQNFYQEGIAASSAIVEGDNYGQSVLASMQALRAAFFAPTPSFSL